MISLINRIQRALIRHRLSASPEDIIEVLKEIDLKGEITHEEIEEAVGYYKQALKEMGEEIDDLESDKIF